MIENDIYKAVDVVAVSYKAIVWSHICYSRKITVHIAYCTKNRNLCVFTICFALFTNCIGHYDIEKNFYRKCTMNYRLYTWIYHNMLDLDPNNDIAFIS